MQVLDWDGLVALVDEINNRLKQKVPITRTVNSKALIENISLDAKDVGAVAGVQKNGIDLETDNENKVNIEVPEKTSDLINDSGFVKDEDINYTGGTGISVDGKVINHTNSIRAGTVTGTSGQLVNGDTINIPTISYDTEGHIVDTGTTTVTLPSFSDTDEKVATEENDTTKAYVTGTVHSGAYIGTLIYDANIYLDTTAGTLTAKIFKGDLTGNADTATVSTSLQISQTNPDSATSYYIPFGNISSGALTAGYNNGLQYRTLQGTASSYGYGEIYLGNSTASGTAGNKYGLLRFYGNGSNYWNLSGNRDISSNYTVYMPNSGGSLVVATTDAAVGSSTQPIYINASGVATAITGSVGSDTGLMYLNNGEFTTSNVSLGSITEPLYLNNGEFTSCNVTDSSSAAAIDANNALITARSVYYGLPTINGVHNYNSSTNIYAPTTEGTNGFVLLSSGSGAPDWITPEGLSVGTAAKLGSSTVGSSSTPIYLSNGSPTACGYSFSDYLPLSGGTMTGTVAQLNLTLNDGNQQIAVVQMFDEGSTNGSELVIGANGNTFIGSGESYKNLRTEFLNNGTASGESYSATSERLYVTSDTNMYFYSNGNTIADRLGIAYDSDGALRPLVTGTRSLGTSSIHWATAFIDDIQGNISDADVAAKLGTATVGGTVQPIYLNSGSPTAITATVGSTIKPIYLNAGALTASDATIGSAVIPMYMTSGTLTASTSTVGSSTKPIYLNNGALTVSDSTVGGSAQPVYLNSGMITPISTTAGSTTQPVYLNAGVITAMSGALSTSYGGTGNTSGRATYVSVTNTNPTSSTSYYPTWVTGTSSDTNYSACVNNGFRYNTLQGDAETDGYGRLYLGNSTVSGESGNKYGMIRFYGLGENYWTLSGNKDISSNYTIYFPSSGGGLVVSSYGSAIGSGTKPIYISSSGVATASSSTVGSGVIPTYLSSGTITASTSTVGSGTKPIYLNSGTITVSSSTVGSSTQPVYLNSGTITACSTTVGSGVKPIYSNSGVLTVSSSTVGSASIPIYLNSGSLTACTSVATTDQLTDGSVTKIGTATVGSSTKPIYLSSGTPTASSSTVGSATQPVYLSSGTITACSTTVGSGTKPIYSSSGVLTASSSTVGSGVVPMYMSSGTLTASTSTVGTVATPVYLDSGTITACSEVATTSQLTDGSVTKLGTTTYGSTSQPIYWNAGVPAALSATVGSATQPVFLNSGTITACSTTVGSGTKPIYSNSGVLTASSSTVGSGTQPCYLSSGTITACGTTVGSSTKPIYSSSGVLTACSSTVGSSTRPVYMSSGAITQCSTRLDDESIGGFISSGSYKDVVQTYDSTGTNRVGTIRINKNDGYNTILIGPHDESNSAPTGLTVRSTDGVIRVTVPSNTEYTTYEVRNIAFSTSVPTSLSNGYICFVYS